MNIPLDRFDDFLDELHTILEIARAIHELNKVVSGKENPKTFDVFTWIDDGKKDMRLNIHYPEEKSIQE